MLWIDHGYTKAEPVVASSLNDLCHVNVITTDDNINDSILRYQPDIICFDYDLPGQVGLRIVRDVKCRHPSIPFIMLTEDHSKDLAIWALRLRTWDYFVKPVVPGEVATCIDTLLGKLTANTGTVIVYAEYN